MGEVNIGGVYTLLDLAKMMNPSDGSTLFCAETLARKNPIVREAPMIEANQLLTHVGNRDLALPTIGFRAINEGVTVSAHKEKQITEPMALMEALSQIDEEILRLAGSNATQMRQRKDKKHIEAMAQKLADTIFYGSLATDELSFNGLATRFNSSTTYPNGDSTWYYNVALNGGSGSDTTSIWMIEWDPDSCCLIYPKNTVGGIEIVDKGLERVYGSATTKVYYAHTTQFKWRAGIFIGDERCVQRIANIESSGVSNTFDDDKMIEMLNRLPSMGEGPNTKIYVNRTIRTQMDIRVKDKTNVNYTAGTDAFGRPTLSFRGVPVQVCDGIKNTETAIS